MVKESLERLNRLAATDANLAGAAAALKLDRGPRPSKQSASQRVDIAAIIAARTSD